jgi:hypothetical protein
VIGDVGNHPTQHGVTEELETFVRGVPGILGAPRPVGKGLAQQERISELVAEPARERLEVRAVAQVAFTLAYT